MINLLIPKKSPTSNSLSMLACLKCHYDESRIFSIEAILKHKQVACMRRKMSFIIFKYLFLFVCCFCLKICKLAKWWRHTLSQMLIKYDEKRHRSQFVSEMFSFLCSKILLNVLHNLSLTVFLPWQHTGLLSVELLAYQVPMVSAGNRCRNYVWMWT